MFLVLGMFLSIDMQKENQSQYSPSVVKTKSAILKKDSPAKIVTSNNNKFLARYDEKQNTLRIYDKQTGKELSELQAEILYGQDPVDQILFVGDNSGKLLVTSRQNPLKIIDWRSSTVENEVNTVSNACARVPEVPVKKFLAVSN
jgi:ABC-type Fe3+/spermidine/putrescine transport system ATPase subunit